MSKLLDKIRNLFKEDNQFIKDESLKAVNTWLLEDTLPEKQPVKPVSPQKGYQQYKEVSQKTKEQEAQKIAQLFKGAKTNFTQKEFDDRKDEILDFLNNLKEQKKKK